MSRISVKSEILEWAMTRSSHSATDLSRKFPKIADWVDGKLEPTLRQLEKFASATHTPLGYLFLEKPPTEVLPVPFFRTAGKGSSSEASPDLIDTLQTMEQRQFWLREYLVEQGADPLDFSGSTRRNTRPDRIARKMMELLEFKDDWASVHSTWTDALSMLQDAIDRVGITVVVNGVVGNNTHRKLSVDEFRGFVLVDDYAPLVFVNGSDSKAAQMFTLAHELAHIFLGSSAAFDLRTLDPANDPVEIACNKAAAEFLIPAHLLLESWPSIKDKENRFGELARRFKVSELVVARKALDSDLISRAEFLTFYEWYSELIRSKKRKSTGGDFYATQNLRIGKRFARAVKEATRDNSLLYHDAYRLTGIHGKTFEQYMDKVTLGVSN